MKKGNNLLNDSTLVDYLLHPLNTWAKSIELAVNGLNVTTAHTNNLEISYLLNLSYTGKGTQHDLVGINLGYLDTLRNLISMNLVDNDNKGAAVFNLNKGGKKKETSDSKQN